jgi:tetratricopeptide (TPR) repeat protein
VLPFGTLLLWYGRGAMRLRDLAVFSLLFATAALGAHGPRAFAADPPPEVLDTLAHGKNGPEVARAAEALLKDYRSHPRASEAAELLAEYAYARGEYRAAAKHYETAIDLTRDPNLIARRRLWRSRALLAAGDAAGARHDLEAIGTRGPFADDAALGLADAAFLSGRTDRAIELYQSFSNKNQASPLRPIAIGQLALVLERTGRSGQALELSRELVADYPAAHEAAAARERIRRAAKAAQTEAAPEAPAAKTPPATTKTPDRSGAASKSADDQAKKAKEPEQAPPASGAAKAPPPATEHRLESGVEAGSGGRYSLQIGAFGDRENAADLARQLEQLGLPSVRVEEEMRGDRRFFRVRVGSYADPATAEAEGQKLKTGHGLAYRVVEN